MTLSVRNRLTGLWGHPDFLKLWAAHTASQFGTQITLFAVPLIAVITLDASAAQMGLLTAAGQAPLLLVGLFAGVWVDRLSRRPVLIAADLGRCLLILAIPALAALDQLQIIHLYLIIFLVGIFSVFFDVADHSYLPTLVDRSQLTEGNGKLQMSRAVARLAGPGAAGWLVRVLSAPLALLVDAITYLISAAFVWAIRTPEPSPALKGSRASVFHEIREGIGTVLGNPVLRPLAGCTATINLFLFIIRAVLILYATRSLGIGPGLLGLIFTIGSIGAVAGSPLAVPIAARLGVGNTLLISTVISSAGMLLIPLASGPLAVTVPMLATAQILGAFGGTVYNINQISLRQAITPEHLLGRMNATMRVIVWGTIPLGGLLGGILGETLGLRTTLLLGAVGGLSAGLWVALPQVRLLHDVAELENPAPSS